MPYARATVGTSVRSNGFLKAVALSSVCKSVIFGDITIVKGRLRARETFASSQGGGRSKALFKRRWEYARRNGFSGFHNLLVWLCTGLA